MDLATRAKMNGIVEAIQKVGVDEWFIYDVINGDTRYYSNKLDLVCEKATIRVVRDECNK